MKASFDGICAFREKNPGIKGSGLITSDPYLDQVKADLESLRSNLDKKFHNYRGIVITVKESKGATQFPFVPHVCLLPPNQSVSNGVYVAICFDKYGKGALVGCAESKSNSQGLEVVIRKSRGLKPKIDVDGSGENTKYNNVFSNPKEFYFPLKSVKDFVIHVERSLDLALMELGYDISSNMASSGVSEFETELDNEADSLDLTSKDENDARNKTLKSIVSRRGQKKFRNELVAVYKKCVVTECSLVQALEAAHIVGYNGDKTNHIQNGLLLRSDIHTLYDLGLISINPSTLKIEISSELHDTEYESYEGKILKGLIANKKALEYHYDNVFNH